MGKNSRFYWLSWLSHTLRYARRGDLGRAANYLLRCLPDDDFDEIDHAGARQMFMSPELVPYRIQLWAVMFPLIVPECVARTREVLVGYGWEIPMTDDERMWVGFHQVRAAFGYNGLCHIEMERNFTNTTFIDAAGQARALAYRYGDKIALYLFGSRFGIVGRMFYITDDNTVTEIDGRPVSSAKSA